MNKEEKRKTYILKRTVINDMIFPIGTIIEITDDYWGEKSTSPSDKNTGFTVVEGQLKGQKGCVVDGLESFIAEDTEGNMLLIKRCLESIGNLKKQINDNHIIINNLPTPILT